VKIIYTPEGCEPREWDFEPKRLLNVEAELIEDVTGWTFDEFGANFLKGSTKARHAALWVMLKRETPTLKYAQVQFSLGELDVEFTAQERLLFRAALEAKAASEGLDEKEQKALDGLIELEAADAAPKEPETLSGELIEEERER